MASAAFRMTSAHDFVAGAVLLKHGFEVQPSAEIVCVKCAECR